MSFISKIGHDLHNISHGIEHGIEGVGKGIGDVLNAPIHATKDLVTNTISGHPFKGFKEATEDLVHGATHGVKHLVGGVVGGTRQALEGVGGLGINLASAPEQLPVDLAKKSTSYL